MLYIAYNYALVYHIHLHFANQVSGQRTSGSSSVSTINQHTCTKYQTRGTYYPTYLMYIDGSSNGYSMRLDELRHIFALEQVISES